MSNFRYVGNPSLQNVDGADKVSGRAKYVCDMVVPRMLIAKILRSPVPHARIVKLDTAPALAVPGVKAVITHADFVDDGNFGWPVKDAYILAVNKVRHVGEPVAAVAAETEAAAIAGLNAIIVEYEPLPVIGTVDQAMVPDAPIIPEVSPTGKGNLCNTHILRNGDPEPLLAEAPVRFEATYMRCPTRNTPTWRPRGRWRSPSRTAASPSTPTIRARTSTAISRLRCWASPATGCA